MSLTVCLLMTAFNIIVCLCLPAVLNSLQGKTKNLPALVVRKISQSEAKVAVQELTNASPSPFVS